MISGSDNLLGLIGHPVQKSPGQLIYNTIFTERKLRNIYISVDIHPWHFNDIMKELPNFFSGFNVTIPYKEKAVSYMDSIDTISESTGSVNLVVAGKGKTMGYNSDFYGFMNALPHDMDRNLGRVLIYGSGGTARTAFYAIQKAFSPGEIFVVSRNTGNVHGWFRERGAVIKNYDDIGNLGEIDSVVNCTPRGMMGRSDTGLKLPPRLSEGFLAIDFVYSKNMTEFLTEASVRGGSIVTGNDIFIYQAIENLRKWFDISVSPSDMRAYFDEAMEIMDHA